MVWQEGESLGSAIKFLLATMKTFLRKIFGTTEGQHKQVSIQSDYLIGIAQSCEIAAVLEMGRYSAILVQIDVLSIEFTRHLVDHNALSIFVNAIEQRIDNNEIEDPMQNHQNMGLKPTSPTLNEVKRVIIASDQKLIYTWIKQPVE